MYISKVLSAKTRALLSGGFGRLDSAKPDGHTQKGGGNGVGEFSMFLTN